MRVLCDTNILIEFYKTNPTDIRNLQGIGINLRNQVDYQQHKPKSACSSITNRQLQLSTKILKATIRLNPLFIIDILNMQVFGSVVYAVKLD